MSTKSETWGVYAAKVAVAGAVMMAAAFVGNRLAQAGPGEPVRDALTVSGVLRGVSGTATVAFRFYRAMGDTTPLCAPEVMVTPDATTGAFSVEVPLRQPGRECPGTLFHDPSVLVEVAVGGAVVAVRAPINPVPYAHYASQYGTPDCPVGYERDRSEAAFTGDMRLCVRRRTDGTPYDEVVRVGTGASAFWIDRYEASVWPNADGRFMDGRATPYGNVSDDYPPQFPVNGQWTTARPPVYAVSQRGMRPSQFITWFRAMEACASSGKRLPTNSEWLRAARGTPDPTDTAASPCTVDATMTTVSNPATRCRSEWMATDMVGNVRELTDEWYVGVGDTERPGSEVNRNWPADYGADLASNIAARVTPSYGAGSLTLPAAAQRGGGREDRQNAGVFAIMVHTAPTISVAGVGFRCVIPR